MSPWWFDVFFRAAAVCLLGGCHAAETFVPPAVPSQPKIEPIALRPEDLELRAKGEAIRCGMTMSEVNAILGRESDRSWGGGTLGPRWYSWVGQTGFLEVYCEYSSVVKGVTFVGGE